MSASDVFPVDPDYTVVRKRQANVLRGTLKSGVEFFRQKSDPKRTYTLTFEKRPRIEYTEVEKFRLRMQTDFFRFNDKTRSEYVDVFFDGEVKFEEEDKEAHTFSVKLVEKI